MRTGKIIARGLWLMPFVCVSLGLYAQGQTPAKPWMDQNLPPAARVEALLATMSLDEKIGQMAQVARDYIKNPADIGRYALGSILSGGNSTPDFTKASDYAQMYDKYQAEALKSRLGIPIIYGIDSVHGNNSFYSAVIFPHNIGLAAAGDPSLMERVCAASALETAAVGLDWTFAPCVAVVQDERWGRFYEGLGEEPGLASLLAQAAVKGFQGTASASQFNDGRRVLACAKHYIGDGGTQGGKDQGDTQIDETGLRTLFLPPYKAAVEAGVGSIMVSFSSWNGKKMHQSDYLINKVLKGELGFKGFIVSDWGGQKQLPGDSRQQIISAVNAGVDMMMVPDDYREFISGLKSAVTANLVSNQRVDDAVRRILLAKFKLGLFDRPFSDPKLLGEIGSPAHRELAREAVRRSAVLLKNQGLLPLAQKPLRIGLFGEGADDIGLQCGGWTMGWQGTSGPIVEGSSIFQAIQEAAPKGSTVILEPKLGKRPKLDVAIVVAAEEPYAEGEGDNAILSFPKGRAKEALNELRKAKVPTLVILLSGRPLTINEELKQSKAFIAAWLPGSQAQGLADLIFGTHSPSGKLPCTWFDSVKSIPINSRQSGKGVLFPCGYGLTY